MALPTRSRVWLAAYVVIAVLDVIAEGVYAHRLAFVGSFLAMPALIGVLYTAKPNHGRFYWLVTGALFFSWLGDWLGDLIPPHVLVKIGFFFIGHLFFLAAFWPYARRSILHRPPILIAYVVVIGGLIAWIAPHGGRIAPAIVVYGIFLGTMAVLSTGVNRTSGIGGAIFVASDLTIAVTAFVFPGRVAQAELIIMSSYLVAQLLIVFGALHVPPRPAPRSEQSAVGAPRSGVLHP